MSERNLAAPFGASIALLTLAACPVFPADAPHPDAPPAAAVKQLLTQSIAEYPGHELTMLTVTYPPGGRSDPHRHDAYVFVYVLDGALKMKVKGEPLRIVRAGETFAERPNDVHEVSGNASADRPATFLVVALKESDRPLTRPAADH